MINNLGIDPDDWFTEPWAQHTAPVPEWDKNKKVEFPSELKETPTSIEFPSLENPDESDEIEEEKTIHQKMYEIATAKYNPFSVGGSDNFLGGSENLTES